MTTLDEIAARHEKVTQWWLAREPGHVFTQPRQDVGKLLAALQAVERLAKHADETHAELPLPHGPLTKGYAMAIRDVRAAITGALQ